MAKATLRRSTASLALLMAVGCNANNPKPFDPVAWQQTQRKAAVGRPIERMDPLPTTLESPILDEDTASTKSSVEPTTGPALGTEPVLRLTLQDVVQRAAANSLDVKVAGYGPGIEGTRVTEAEARFDPVFFSNVSYERRNIQTAGSTIFDPNGGPFGTGANIITDSDEADIATFQTGLRQNLEAGGQVELRYQLQQNDFSPKRFEVNPYYENELVLQITQPLLRDFGADVNRARIVISRNNQRISLLDFRKQLEETIATVEETYWQLVASERRVKIREELLARTITTGDILFKRLKQDVSRVQISQANAEIEFRRGELIRARADVRNLSDRLKQLMNDADIPVAGATLILPANDPVEEAIHFDLKEQIDAGLENRLELGQQQIRIDSASVTARAAKVNLLPQLNLVGSVSAQGLDDDLGSSYENIITDTHFGYSVGLQFEIPLGNREARAIWVRTLLQRQQAIDSYRAIVEQVALDVKTAIREVNTTWDQMVAAQRQTFAASDALLALDQRQDAGEALTPTFVNLKLDAQQRLATAEENSVNATSLYNIAISRLERAKGTLLRYNNVEMAEDTQLPHTK